MPRTKEGIDELDMDIIKSALSGDKSISDICKEINIAYNNLLPRIKKLLTRKMIKKQNLGKGKRIIIHPTKIGVCYYFIFSDPNCIEVEGKNLLIKKTSKNAEAYDKIRDFSEDTK